MTERTKVIWLYIDALLDKKISPAVTIKEISKKAKMKERYAEAFVIAVNNMLVGECIYRTICTKTLEELIDCLIEKYGNKIVNNIVISLEKYKNYEPHNKKNSKTLTTLIKKVSDI